MKKIKLTVFLILVVIGLLFMGELNNLNVSSFQNRYYSCDFFIDNLETEVSEIEMKEDFLREAKKYNVDFFAVKKLWNETYLYETRIIGTSGAIEHLRESGLKEGENKSLFFDNESITFERYEDAEDVSAITGYYFIGDKDDLGSIRSFKSALVDKYGGGFPKEKADNTDQTLAIVICWGLIFSIMLALSLYEVIYSKKENMIRVIMGDSVVEIFLKSVLLDIVGFGLIFAVCRIALENVSHVGYKSGFVIALFIVFLLVNTAIEASILNINYKRDLSGVKNSTILLKSNYVIKAVLSVLVILLVSINIYTITEALNVLSLKDLFSSLDGYDFYKYDVKATEEDFENGVFPEEEAYSRFYEKYQDRALLFGDCSGDFGISSFVRIDHNALVEICRRNPKLKDLYDSIDSANRTILIPDNINKYDFGIIEELKIDGNFEEDIYGDVRLMKYPKGIKVPAIRDDSFGYQIRNLKNPVIWVDNYTFDKSRDYFDGAHNYCVMYNITADEWESFKTKNGVNEYKTSVTDASDEYEHIRGQQEKKLIIIMAISVFVLFLEFSMIYMIIHMEYSFNAIEQALKKVFGYTLWERNIRIIKVSILSSALGLVMAIILKFAVGINVRIPILIILSVALLSIELIVLLVKALSIEKLNIARILKGENI